MSREDGLPPELEQLDRALGGIAFQPRASLGPELLGRLRRGDPSRMAVPPARRGPTLAAAAAGLVLVTAAALTLRAPAAVEVDRCCYDLDGGGEADDGVLIEGERDARVHRLRVYEDRDHSGGYTAADLIRFDRQGAPSLQGPPAPGLVTIERCCLDFDGGGPEDDGLLVIGVPPDRVVMAAIYEPPHRMLR